MAEVSRKRTGAVLLAAHSITIALDDRGPYRGIRYRCDVLRGQSGSMPLESRGQSGGMPLALESQSGGMPLESQYVGHHDGILGVHVTSAKPEDILDVLDEDYSERMRDSVVAAVKLLFTIDGVVDETHVTRVLAKTHTFLGDRASPVQKCEGPC